MKANPLLILLCLLTACDTPNTGSATNEAPSPTIAFSVVNARNDNGTLFYDIYVKDTAAIAGLNRYLVNQYDRDKKTWIEINYFNDSLVAKDYFNKQVDGGVSETEKDGLFKHFIANYKCNPNSGYDTLVYER